MVQTDRKKELMQNLTYLTFSLIVIGLLFYFAFTTKSDQLTYAFVISISLSISGFLFFEAYRKKHAYNRLHDLAQKHEVHIPHPHPETEKLVTYIIAARKYGYSDAQIQDKLLALGWQKDLVDEAFADMQ